MGEPTPKNLSSEALRAFMAGRNESDYLLVDVRQPGEYEAGHIPGAFLLPLSELESTLFKLPADRDLIFYCRSGARSQAAASLAAEAEVTERGIFNLEGGILAWNGKKLADFPRVQVFEKKGGLASLLYTAMDLEKGAWRFYRTAVEKAAGLPLEKTLSKLAAEESAHAKAVYKHWAPIRQTHEAFEDLFETLSGDILEGGETLDSALARLEAISGAPCLDLVEMALAIEYAAYDLYRNVAEKSEDSGVKSALLSIAQAEKGHMRVLSRSVAICSE